MLSTTYVKNSVKRDLCVLHLTHYLAYISLCLSRNRLSDHLQVDLDADFVPFRLCCTL